MAAAILPIAASFAGKALLPLAKMVLPSLATAGVGALINKIRGGNISGPSGNTLPLGKPNYLSQALQQQTMVPADKYEQMASGVVRRVMGRKSKTEVPTFVDVLAHRMRERDKEMHARTGGPDPTVPELLNKPNSFAGAFKYVHEENSPFTWNAYTHTGRDKLHWGVRTRPTKYYGGHVYERVYNLTPEEQIRRSKMMHGGGIGGSLTDTLGKVFGGLAPAIGRHALSLGKEAASKVASASVSQVGQLVADKIAAGKKPSVDELTNILRGTTSEELLRITRPSKGKGRGRADVDGVVGRISASADKRRQQQQAAAAAAAASTPSSSGGPSPPKKKLPVMRGSGVLPGAAPVVKKARRGGRRARSALKTWI